MYVHMHMQPKGRHKTSAWNHVKIYVHVSYTYVRIVKVVGRSTDLKSSFASFVACLRVALAAVLDSTVDL